jgi:hypothetical protein
MVQVVPGRREGPRLMASALPALDCPKTIVARPK